jgi:hypothetical protein
VCYLRGAQYEEPVVIVGFGPHGQALATLLCQPLASLPSEKDRAYIAFDLDPTRVQVGEAGVSLARMRSCAV